ncbi:3D-(3,5/4)-trihydroxycyclohexane-1,2-dione acylhydrolase (decyclizing) [Kocuria flava]|uniref:3D-(3,5/4)-trihydroxycyclohexane-1,2-dione acylhydrolase (Decyclizing) n=1 Tax=Kocuria flava TaxID=446860 RepID=A0A0U3G3G7_9MICC|nr:3D-(3,5/4)-trihydroxycyclohexane-1,2-dione acylhydrolase (decyclizing) [Kocuria flava]ALU39498.1 3D-(3,5/4)-trihydroxycyclohexane-1,2-dione acylhydrolase (decyclizing) [Kocuria flava]GEO93129.1 3D-(3,5/4)-trihydroxycyclohexane-1,2-dione acylhydrolase (decyclizing) [Kocuria flava]
MSTRTLSVSQALVEFLANQWTVDRVGGTEHRERTIPGMFGIFGHGNVAGVGQALKQYQASDPRLMPYYQGRNEQAQVHQAVGWARHTRRRSTFAVSTSIGPGATNMVTGAALATTNRLPALLLPSDQFASRAPDPVLQQLERPDAGDLTVNDVFRPVSRFFDRVWRPEQLFSALLNGMRVLTDPAETGAVTIALPQDVQAETLEVPEEFLAPREWRIRRPAPEEEDVRAAVAAIRAAERPVVIAGGGVHYAFATEALREFAETTGIPVAYTQAGVGVLDWDHPRCLGAVGSTGSTAANAVVAEADLVIGIGTRYEDFTTASRTAFQHPGVRFLNINVAAFDAHKLGTSLPVVADARKTLVELTKALGGYRVGADLAETVATEKRRWDGIVDDAFGDRHEPLPSQNEIIGAVNGAMAERDVVICAAGSLPGDLHKMWRVKDPYGYHVEYAYSCMGYEIAGGLGVKRAALAEAARDGQDPRDVVVMVGDGSYLMMHTELVTAVAEGLKLVVVLIQNHGYASIGALSEQLGSQRFGTKYRYLDEDRHSFDDGSTLPIDLATNAESLGVRVLRVEPGEGVIDRLAEAVAQAKAAPEGSGPVLVHVESDPLIDAPSSESWWDVPVTATAELDSTNEAYALYQQHKSRQRPLLGN